ncbi:MAG: hypothetical protein JW876_06100 [Candidatus Krumholzibacteriota bacterium]|nr:hypothetical protein [Candidatus Krumholzibacteriota bacterium]
MRYGFVLPLFLLIVSTMILSACGDENDILEPGNVLSGTVTDNSGMSGTVIVEIDYNIRDIADEDGRWAISVRDFFYVDSLYAYVDVDGDGGYDQGEPFGFYHSADDDTRAKAFTVRNTDVGNLDFSIP